MSQYEIYVFILCFIVFAMLTALSVVAIVIITKLTLKLINAGVDDNKIVEQNKKIKNNNKNSKFSKAFDCIVSLVFCIVFVGIFSASIFINCTQNADFKNLPVYRVVNTGSMSYKNKKNDYLRVNNLNNQIQTFDLIATHSLPKEEDLKLYDIVVYEVDDMLIVHRIVGIEEPNQEHPGKRYFLLQGDAVESPDRFPVLYEQMRAIYTGERLPFVGSFVLFMQSPAGWLCMLLVVFAIFATPIIEKKIKIAQTERLIALGEVERSEQPVKEKKKIKLPKIVRAKAKPVSGNFTENLINAPKFAKDSYCNIADYLEKIKGVSVTKEDANLFYNVKNLLGVRFSLKGNNLIADINLTKAILNNVNQKEKDSLVAKICKKNNVRVKLTDKKQEQEIIELVKKVVEENEKVVSGAKDET